MQGTYKVTTVQRQVEYFEPKVDPKKQEEPGIGTVIGFVAVVGFIVWLFKK